VVAILKLAQILPKMLPADMDMRSIDTALQLRPEALDGIDASAARLGIFTCFVVHFDMAIARAVNIFVAAKFIGVDSGSGQYLVKNKGLHIGFAATGNNASDQFTTPLKHPDHSRLIALVAATFARNRA